MVLFFVEEVPLQLYEVGGEENVVAEGGEDLIEVGRGGCYEGWEGAVFTTRGGCGEGAGLGLEVEAAETGAAVVGWGEGEGCHCWVSVLGSWIVGPIRLCHCCFDCLMWLLFD